MIRYFLFLIVFLLFQCSSQPSNDPEEVIEKAIQRHGLDHLSKKTLSFDFRDIHYVLKRDGQKTVYSREITKGDSLIKDVLKNGVLFERAINGSKITLSDSLKTLYSNALNSVMYFIQIPLVLQDKSVVKEYLGKKRIAGATYHILKITFLEQGGGQDFQDEYRYWIHETDYTIDYLGYNYQTSGGGTRFRQVTKRQKIEGILFQDYKNFKPQRRFVNLDSLPTLFENQQLLNVSYIENQNIRLHP